MACSPLVVGDLVIVTVGATEATVAAWDRKSGNLKWKAGRGAPAGYSSPAVLKVAGREQLVVMHLYDDRESDLRAHQGILAAMRARKPVRASQLMRDHLRDVREVVSAALASSPR